MYFAATSKMSTIRRNGTRNIGKRGVETLKNEFEGKNKQPMLDFLF